MEKENKNSKCKLDKKLDFNQINKDLKKDYPIKKKKISPIMKKNLDRLGIRYGNE